MSNCHVTRLSAVLALLLTATIPCVAVAQERQPIPDDAAQKAAFDLIAEVYKADFDAAKTPVQKFELATRLMQVGIATNVDIAGQFVLLRIARDIAAENGDLDTALDAIDQFDSRFECDRYSLQLDAASTAAKATKTPADHAALAATLVSVIDDAINSDRYDDAKVLAELALGCARQARDRIRTQQLAAKVKDIDEIQVESVKVQAALKVLAERPADPDSNFAVGRFLCLVKGDWQRGIPMLALGSDDDFKSAAVLELEDTPNALRIGDAWWSIAERVEGTPKTRAQGYAGKWYRKALRNLSGLNKTRVERIVASIPPEDDWIDLTAKIEVKRDTLAGTWAKTDDGLWVQRLDEYGAQLTVPYRLPRTYELEVSFTRKVGTNDLSVAFPVGRTHCMCMLSGWHGQASGLAVVDGVDIRSNATSVQPGTIRNNQKYELRISVDLKDNDRTAVIEIELNGKPYIAYNGPTESLTAAWGSQKPGMVQLCAFQCEVVFHSARVREK
jgi:hypothetical protein